MQKAVVDLDEFLAIKSRLGVRNNEDMARLIYNHTGVVVNGKYLTECACKFRTFSPWVSATLRLVEKAGGGNRDFELRR